MGDGINPLVDLGAAYDRLALDRFAVGIEKIDVWKQWHDAHGDQERAALLSTPELQALAQVLTAARKLKGNGGDCTTQLLLLPAQQLECLQEWKESILQWNELPFPRQRDPSLVSRNKEIVNACCTHRKRDEWKHTCLAYARLLAECVQVAQQNLSAIWKGDLAHHVVLQLVLASPNELALPLASELPVATGVRTEDRYTYERALVCILRSKFVPAVHVVKKQALPALALPRCSWRLRLAGHFLTHGTSGGARVLRLLLQLSDSEGQQLLKLRAGLLFVQRCLRVECEDLKQPLLELRVRSQLWGDPERLHEPTRPAWLRRLEDAASVPTPMMLCSASPIVPDRESMSETESMPDNRGTGPETPEVIQNLAPSLKPPVISWAPLAYWKIQATQSLDEGVCFFLHLPRKVS